MIKDYKSEYRAWANMKQRCDNKRLPNYKHYGGRGIKYCQEWCEFVGFLGDMGVKPRKELSLDRIDNDGDYCKRNCKWSTRAEQMNNTRVNVSIEERLRRINNKYDNKIKTKMAIKSHRFLKIKKGVEWKVLLCVKRLKQEYSHSYYRIAKTEELNEKIRETKLWKGIPTEAKAIELLMKLGHSAVFR